MRRRLIIVLGPTAVGKTDYSIELALKHGSPVISCDSRQIYREMSIGTAVPDASQLTAVKHYFIQSNSVTEYYTAGIYEEEALDLIQELFGMGHDTLVMSGGSMFYIDAICNSLSGIPTADLSFRDHLQAEYNEKGAEWLQGELKKLDPEAFASMDLSNTQRLLRAVEICRSTGQAYSSFKRAGGTTRDFDIELIGLNRSREDIYGRINRRVVDMMDMGLVDEVHSLKKYRELTPLKTVGYREIFDYFDGTTSLDEAVALIQRNTRHYAKRQLTWWRRNPSIKWIDL